MSQMTSLEKDTESRNRIVSDINNNFFVEAGAGSGKTTMLVSRMVAMVEAGIPIEKICAITFTRAAAGEFYDRFQRLLIERSNPNVKWEDKGFAGQLPAPTEETRKLCSEALKNIDLCFMGTIDSFCGRVLSEHPSEAGIPSDAAIILDQDAEIIYKQQYVKICSGEYGNELAELAGRFRQLHKKDEAVFVQGISVFMNHRNVHFHYTKREAVDINKAFASERNVIIRAAKFLLKHPELKFEHSKYRLKDNQKAWEALEDTVRAVRKRWGTNFPNVLYALDSFQNIRVVPEAVERYGNHLLDVFELRGKKEQWLGCTCGDLLIRLKNLQYSVSMEFLERCVPILESVMRDKGTMTFFDYLYYLRNMLRRDAEENGSLIRYIYDRHSYFLIDEFQDTNPMQAEIFFYLSSEHPVAQWSACVPRPGSLFIVGDPKQSIYRFRSADVTSFLKVKGLFEKNGGAILSLSRNFRSTKTLCKYFNHVFKVMLPEETLNQSKFEDIPLPEKKADEFQGIYSYHAICDSGPAEEAEPGKIAKIIETLVDNDQYMIRAGGDQKTRKIRFSDIMVITYGKKNLEPILSYLDMKDIPTRVEGEVPFGANEALAEVFKLYSAIADAEDAVSLYGSLTGSLFGLYKEEILRYKAKAGSISLTASFDVDGCDDTSAQFVASKLESLKEMYQKAQGLSPAALFAEIMDEFRIYETVEAENLEIMYYVLELMRNAEKSGLLVTLKDGAEYLQKLVDGISGEERCLRLNDGKDVVHLANLHKVKGLEAPVVILAGESAGGNKISQRIVHGDNGSDGYLFNLPKRNAAGIYRGFHFVTNEFFEERKLELDAALAEKERLAYVAATRARNVLIIRFNDNASGTKKYESIWTPLLSSKLEDFFEVCESTDAMDKVESETVEASMLYEEAEKSCVLNDRNMEAATYSVENPSCLQLASKILDVAVLETDFAEAAVEHIDAAEPAEQKAGGIHRFSALFGSMTHKLMEMLVSSKDKIDGDEVVGEIIREYRTPDMESYEAELSETLSKVAKTMRTGGYIQTNGLPQDLLQTLLHADEVYCEVPFCYSEESKEGRKLWNGVMDVVYCLNGKWHIVDYKTNADGNDLDQKYQAQLEAYIKAFKAITGQEADALTYHIAV